VVWPPSARQSARGAIEELMRARGLRGGFDRQLQRAAERARDRVPDPHGAARRDLRQLPTFTVDPQSARDFDDALSAESLPGGAVRVWVHIADVAAYVPEGSPLDLEARRRGTSVYVPGGVEPMLPAELSNDACSLLPGGERLAVTTELELRDAEVERVSFYRSLIRSDARLDYERVDRIFAGLEAAEEPWDSPLKASRAAATALQRARSQRGALVVDSEEPEFFFDDEGNVSEIRARSQTEAHRLIEHLMITANEAVARLLQQRRVPCLYRVHQRPEPASIARLADQLASLDVPTPPLPEHMSPSQAADAVGEISRLVDAAVRRGGHGRMAFSALLLRSLKQAYYSPKNLGHAGLRSSTYCHFTSPIRRYPDLVCHRALLSAVGGGERAPRARELVELGAWTSECERAAMAIEREADDIARCFALEQLLYDTGWEQTFSGEVIGLIAAGAFVAFGGAVAVAGAAVARGARDSRTPTAPGNAYEGMLPVRLLHSGAQPQAARDAPRGAPARDEDAREWWELNELGTILHGQRTGATLRLGDQIEVRVARVDAPRGRVDLLPAVPIAAQ
jgi:ribonuclease R